MVTNNKNVFKYNAEMKTNLIYVPKRTFNFSIKYLNWPFRLFITNQHGQIKSYCTLSRHSRLCKTDKQLKLSLSKITTCGIIGRILTVSQILPIIWQAILFAWSIIICKLFSQMVVVRIVCGPPKIREIGFLTSYIEHLDTTKIIQNEICPIFCHEKQLSFMVWNVLLNFEKKLLKISPKFLSPTVASYYIDFS